MILCACVQGHEDLRQDERVMQLFGLVNNMLANDRTTAERDLSIARYAVIPLSPNSGLIGWVPNTDTLHALIRSAAAFCCAVLCCAVLCCAVPCCAVLCRAVLCCAVLGRVDLSYCGVCCNLAVLMLHKTPIYVSLYPLTHLSAVTVNRTVVGCTKSCHMSAVSTAQVQQAQSHLTDPSRHAE